MEKILSIKGCSEAGMEGYEVKTTEQEIKLLIDSYQSCCENWGYFMSEDDVDKFVGAELFDISIVDKTLNVKKFNEELEYGLDDGYVMFVNLSTSKGVLQFTAYNSHNGYYGHEAKIISRQLTHEEWL